MISYVTDYHTSSEELVDLNALTGSDRHRLLADERRCHVLRILADRYDQVGLGDLANEVADREADLDLDDGDSVTLVETSLHHEHLPMIEQLRVLDYDPARTGSPCRTPVGRSWRDRA